MPWTLIHPNGELHIYTRVFECFFAEVVIEEEPEVEISMEPSE